MASATMLLRGNRRAGSVRFWKSAAGNAVPPRVAGRAGRTSASRRRLERKPQAQTDPAGVVTRAETPSTKPTGPASSEGSGRRRVRTRLPNHHAAAAGAGHRAHRRRPAGWGGARASQSCPAGTNAIAGFGTSRQAAADLCNRCAIFRKQQSRQDRQAGISPSLLSNTIYPPASRWPE